MQNTLEDIGAATKFIDLIWHCISPASIKVLWNGEAIGPFIPSHGIRQGN